MTPWATAGRCYVRLFLIFYPPDPRLRETPLFCVNATPGPVEKPGAVSTGKTPQPTIYAPDMNQHTSKHHEKCVKGRVGFGLCLKCVFSSHNLVTNRCEKNQVTRKAPNVQNQLWGQEWTRTTPGHHPAPFVTFGRAALTVTPANL